MGKEILLIINFEDNQVYDLSEEGEVSVITGMYGSLDAQKFEKISDGIKYKHEIKLKGDKKDEFVKYKYNNSITIIDGKPKRFYAVVDQSGLSFNNWKFRIQCRDFNYTEIEKKYAKRQQLKIGNQIVKNTEGMPDWFVPLVNRIVKEGDDVTKKLGTVEREIVHSKKISKGEEVTVYQNMDTGNVRIEYGPLHPRASNDLSTVHLEYKAPEEVVTKKGSVKTKSEFSAAESEPKYVATGPDDAEVVWDLDNVVGNVDDLTTDTSKLKEFATKRKLTHKDKVKAKKKQKYREQLESDTTTQVDYSSTKHGEGDYDNYLPDIEDID